MIDPSNESGSFLPHDFDLAPASRHPIRLNDAAAQVAAGIAPQFQTRHAPSPPEVSIIVVTHNNLAFTRLCLASIAAHTSDVDYEIIIVDNASTDGTIQFVEELSSTGWVKAVFNSINAGFAPAVNRGVRESSGQTIVLLNNDVIVSPNWLPGLLIHLMTESVGAVGPVTNRIGNEAEVDTAYRTFDEFLGEAEHRRTHFAGQSTDLPMLAMFCFAILRETWERIGPLDEQFELGMFEDDDYAMRLQAAGLRTVCAEEVLVHHFGQASFGSLVSTGKYAEVFEANRDRFNRKWNRLWQPHKRRRNQYQVMIEAIKSTVERYIPPGGKIAIVSKGDAALIDLPTHSAVHFPQGFEGDYLGHHPPTDAAALQFLTLAQKGGVQYLLFPVTAFWWFERYPRFASTVFKKHIMVHEDAHCRIVDLSRATDKMSP